MSPAGQLRARQTPQQVATPLPPAKRRYGEKQCPTWLTVAALRDHVSAPVSIDTATASSSWSGIEIADFDVGTEEPPLFGLRLDSVAEETSSVTDL